jgi:hypothetical protein
MNGSINSRVMLKMRKMMGTFQDALAVEERPSSNTGNARLKAMQQLIHEVVALLNHKQLQEDAGPLLDKVCSVIQMMAVEVLKIQGSRAIGLILRLTPQLVNQKLQTYLHPINSVFSRPSW